MLGGHFLPNAGAALTLGLGLLALMQPQRIARFVSIAPIGMTGISEIQATYGGFFAAMGGWCLYSQSPPVFFAAGVAWLGAAAGRALSAVINRNYARQNLAGMAFEAGVGLLLIAGGPE